eukprot:g34429.t1
MGSSDHKNKKGGSEIPAMLTTEGQESSSTVILYLLDCSSSMSWSEGRGGKGEAHKNALRDFLKHAKERGHEVWVSAFGPDNANDPRLQLQPAKEYMAMFFDDSIPALSPVEQTFVDMGYSLAAVGQALTRQRVHDDQSAAAALGWLMANGHRYSDGIGKQSHLTFFESLTYPLGIQRALSKFSTSNPDTTFVLVVVGDGCFNASLKEALQQAVSEGHLERCSHVILAVPPEAPRQVIKGKTDVAGCTKVYRKLATETAYIMRQAHSAVFDPIPGFLPEVKAKEASDMNQHIFATMSKQGTDRSFYFPNHYQLGKLLIAKQAKVRSLSQVLEKNEQLRDLVAAKILALDRDTLPVVWESVHVWGKLYAAVCKVSNDYIVWKNKLQMHLATLCSKLDTAQRQFADEFFNTAKQDSVALEELLEKMSKEVDSEGQSRQHALVLREGAEPLDIKTYAYKPEDFSFTLPQLLDALRHKLAVVSIDEAESEDFYAPFWPKQDRRALQVVGMLLGVLTQSSAVWAGGAATAVVMYMVASGFHTDQQTDVRLRNVLLTAARHQRMQQFLERLHVLDEEGAETETDGQVVKAKEKAMDEKQLQAMLIERQAVAQHIGRNFCFAALRWDAAMGGPLEEKTKQLFGTLAKMYLLQSRLRDQQTLFTKQTEVQYPVDGKITVSTEFKRGMLVPMVRGHDGQLSPEIFDTYSRGPCYQRMIPFLHAQDRGSVQQIARNPHHQQLLIYAIDLQLREVARTLGHVCNAVPDVVWDLLTGIGLQFTQDGEVVGQGYALLEDLLYEVPQKAAPSPSPSPAAAAASDSDTAKQKPEQLQGNSDKAKRKPKQPQGKSENELVRERMAKLHRLGGGTYQMVRLEHTFTMRECVEYLGADILEAIAGLPAGTITLILNNSLGAFHKAKALLSLPHMDPHRMSDARVTQHFLDVADSKSKDGRQRYTVKGLELAKCFTLRLPRPASDIPIPNDYVCALCCRLILQGGENDFVLSCCGAHSCSPCLSTSLSSVFAKGARVNRGVAKCVNCFTFLKMKDMQALNKKIARQFKALSDLLLAERPELKEEVKADLSEVLGKCFYVTCVAEGCDVVFNAGPYDCNVHGFFQECPSHRVDRGDLKMCPGCGHEWGPPLYCHHATCEPDLGGCGGHFCWSCPGDGGSEERFFHESSGEAVYQHMSEVHGSWHGPYTPCPLMPNGQFEDLGFALLERHREIDYFLQAIYNAITRCQEHIDSDTPVSMDQSSYFFVAINLNRSSSNLWIRMATHDGSNARC